MHETRTRFQVGNAGEVSGLLLIPDDAFAGLVLAHGAGAGMTHPSMENFARELGDRGVATFRYQFPYMEGGQRRPDPPKIAHATVRAAVAEMARLAPSLPMFAGGRSFGGRMTSQAQAIDPLPDVRGLVFVGFPLHPAGKPSTERGDHLSGIRLPMLFLHGSNDKLAEPQLLKQVCARLETATLYTVEGADHSFHVPKRTGRTDEDIRAEIVDVAVGWLKRIA